MNRGKNSKAYCIFCGSTVGQESDRTGGIVEAVYDCPKCKLNYCGECSFRDGDKQRCLRCTSVMYKIM